MRDLLCPTEFICKLKNFIFSQGFGLGSNYFPILDDRPAIKLTVLKSCGYSVISPKNSFAVF